MVDGKGRRLEVIVLDRCDGHGPQQWIRVSWHHRILLGRGYYRRGELSEALALVDVGTLVEVIPLPVRPLAVQARAASRSAIRAWKRFSTVPHHSWSWSASASLPASS